MFALSNRAFILNTLKHDVFGQNHILDGFTICLLFDFEFQGDKTLSNMKGIKHV